MRLIPGSPAGPAAGGIRRLLMTADAVGGVWQYSMDLGGALAAGGVDVTLAVMGPSPNDQQRADATRRGLHLVHAPFKLEWADAPWRDLDRAGDWLLAVESRTNPDVVHLNGFYHAALPWRSAPLVVAHSCVRSWWRAVHGTPAPAEWDRYTAGVIAGLRSARIVVAPSQAMLEALVREYGDIGEATVIPNGREVVDRMTSEDPLKSEMVLAAGRLWDQAKNIDALCDAAPELPWRVCVAGDAGVGPPCGGRTMNVSYLGRLSPESLFRWYARAAIYALPARYEPFGLSVLEAAASSCALVLGDIPSLRENWDGAALFVSPDDRRALIAAITGLAEDPARRREFARLARERARRFPLDRMRRAYLDVYRRVLPHAAVA
jgi:glycogen(starch) synthase